MTDVPQASDLLMPWPLREHSSSSLRSVLRPDQICTLSIGSVHGQCSMWKLGRFEAADHERTSFLSTAPVLIRLCHFLLPEVWA